MGRTDDELAAALRSASAGCSRSTARRRRTGPVLEVEGWGDLQPRAQRALEDRRRRRRCSTWSPTRWLDDARRPRHPRAVRRRAPPPLRRPHRPGLLLLPGLRASRRPPDGPGDRSDPRVGSGHGRRRRSPGRASPAAVARRPAPTHRAPVPRQARDHRRRHAGSRSPSSTPSSTAPPPPSPMPGSSKGDRLALLCHNCWQYAVLDFATARRRRRARADQLHARRRRDRLHPRPQRRHGVRRRGRARSTVAEQALADTATVATRAVIRLADGDVARRLARRRRTGSTHDGHDGPGRGGRRRRPGAADVHLRHRVAAQGRAADAAASLLWQYVSCALDGDMTADDVELHTPAALPLRAARLLPRPRRLPRRHQRHPARPRPGRRAAGDRASTGSPSSSRRRRSGSGCCAHPDFDDADLSSLQQGLLRRVADAGGDPQGDPAAAARRPAVELLRPDRDGAAGHDPRPRRAARHAGSAGRAGLNVETRIVDDDDVDRCRPARSARSCTARPHATLGYYDDEEKTAEAFRDGWFHSGDLGYVDDDGRLYVVDRKKDMIKTGGENVASREVEEAIYQLDGVAEVAVFGVAHPRWVEAVTAVVVPKAGADAHRRGRAEPTPAAVLAGYKAPKYVVLADALPEEPERQDPQARAARRARRPRRDRRVSLRRRARTGSRCCRWSCRGCCGLRAATR